MAIQAASLDADHEHPLIASTRTFTDPPSGPTLPLVRSSVNRHGAPSCTTSTCADDMVMAPERAVGVVFGATRYESVASPCPLVALRLTQPTGVSADQEHSRSVLTVTWPTPPAAENDRVAAVAPIVHFAKLGETDDDVEEVHAPAMSAMAALEKNRRCIRVTNNSARRSNRLATSKPRGAAVIFDRTSMLELRSAPLAFVSVGHAFEDGAMLRYASEASVASTATNCRQ
jgi:hypothetical protein